MPNPLISQVRVKVNGEYVLHDIKDAAAREAIQALGDACYWIGVTVTPLVDNVTDSPNIKFASYTAVEPAGTENPAEEGWFERSGDPGEYVYTLTEDTEVNPEKTYYSQDGVTARIGGMAQYNGEEFIWNGVKWQSIGKNNFGSLAFKNSAQAAYTPSGSVTINGGSATTDTVTEISSVGTLPEMTVNGEVLTFDAGTLPTTASKTVVTGVGEMSGTFTGTEATIVVS